MTGKTPLGRWLETFSRMLGLCRARRRLHLGSSRRASPGFNVMGSETPCSIWTAIHGRYFAQAAVMPVDSCEIEKIGNRF